MHEGAKYCILLMIFFSWVLCDSFYGSFLIEQMFN